MSANNLQVLQKYTGKLLANIPVHTASDVLQMLEVATMLHKGPVLPKYQRIAILQKLVTLLTEQQEDFATLIANEGGKPILDARVEVTRAIDGVQQAIAVMRTLSGKEIPMEITPASEHKLAFTTLEPIGVVVAISAFNHPLNLIIHQVIPAIASGCPVIIKPARKTPLTCLKFVQLIADAGLPKNWVQVAITSGANAQLLASDPRVAFVSFIGSSEVGWNLKSKLAPGTRCALEHGGVAPVILGQYQNIDNFVLGVVKASMYHAGQVCVSVQRIYVPKDIATNIATAIAKACEGLVVGDATDETVDVGPLIDATEVVRIDSWVQEAIAEGAQLLTGGNAINTVSYQPTVLLNPATHSKVSTQEIFGPVVCVYAYDDIDDAVQSANSLETSFQAAVFSDDIHSATCVAKNLQASAVMINDYTTFRVDWMPFAGRKSSGYGVGGIDYTIRDMLEEKMIVYNTT
jgi:acyl-CoA reductase-like NAD-dependent aldehyde dehydrogenase